MAGFLVAGFAGFWFFTTHAAANPDADLNGDGQVNVFDLSALLSGWGLTGVRPADINHDNIVNVFDLSILLANWGPVTATPTPTPTPIPTLTPTSPAGSVSSISQFGITWTFDSPKTVGQFANGDYWVVGPVTITSISPGSTINSGRTINGSMVNPDAGTGFLHGFDSALNGGGQYRANLNAARPNGNDLSASSPLVLAAGSSLVSSISHPTAGQRPQLTDAAVLTVLGTPAPAGSFRPPYQGTDKTLRWNVSSLNYGILRSLAPVSGTPTLALQEANFERPWLELESIYTDRFFHPSNNQPDYGRDMAREAESAMLSLHLNYSNAQKQRLYTRLVQYGLDVYGAAREGKEWPDLGGHSQGRKMPMILAGLALNDQSILAYGNRATHNIFQEDLQTWIVTQADVGRPLYHDDGRPREEYIQADVGIPEWGEQHTRQPERDGRNWDAFYRDINYTSVTGHALMAHLTPGAVSAWNWPPFFQYTDRAEGISEAEMPTFVRNMWNAYRSTAP